MKKLDIMNSRKDEQWEIVNGKVQRVIPEKVEGPIVQNAIKEIEIKEDIEWKKPILKKKSQKKKQKR